MAGAFFEQVHELVARIPRGKVATYGQIAAYLGHPRGARTVGWAMHGAPPGRRLPCHRVVNVAGEMSPAHVFGGPQRQRERLRREGVTFDAKGRIVMEAHLWRIADDARRRARRSRTRVHLGR